MGVSVWTLHVAVYGSIETLESGLFYIKQLPREFALATLSAMYTVIDA
jgi:hypothetical protein